VTPLATDQWVLLVLAFLLGLFLGMYFLAGGKWKRRYREEVRRRDELEREQRREAHADVAQARAETAGLAPRRGLFGRWRRGI
jgi:uncharacterized membrane-anchored protein YhcB (DUF1043 family)